MRTESSLSDVSSNMIFVAPSDIPPHREKNNHHHTAIIASALSAAAFTAFGFGQTAQAQTTNTAADNMTAIEFGIPISAVAGWDARIQNNVPQGSSIAPNGSTICVVDTTLTPDKNAENCLKTFGLYGASYIAPAYGFDSGNGQVSVMTGVPTGTGGVILNRCSNEFPGTGNYANENVLVCNVYSILSAFAPAAPALKTLGAPGDVPGNAEARDSVVTAAGNYYEAFLAYTTPDYGKLKGVPGNIDLNPNRLAFEYFYNSGKPNAGGETSATSLGAAWSHSFDSSLHFNSSGGAVYSITAELPRGQRISLTQNASGVWAPNTDMDYSLTQKGTGASATWVLVGPDDTADTFNAQGQWQSRTFRTGYTLTGTYNSKNQLSLVTDSNGLALQFSYDQNGFLTTVTTPDNVISFTPKNGQLGTVAYSSAASPNTAIYQEYFYENANFPFFVTHRDTGGVTDLTLKSDTFGRVSSVQKGDSTVPAQTYDYTNAPSVITVTTETQLQKKVTLTQVQGVWKPTEIDLSADPNGTTPAGTWKFGYDTYGFENDKINSKGAETTFLNTSHGLSTKTVEDATGPNPRETDTTPDATFPRLAGSNTLVGVYSETFVRNPATGVPQTVTQVDLTGNTAGAAATRVINVGSDTLGEITSVKYAGPASHSWTWANGVLQKDTDGAGNSTTATSVSSGGFWMAWTTPNTTVAVDLNERMMVTEKDTTGIVNGSKTTLVEKQSFTPAYFELTTTFADKSTLTKDTDSQGHALKLSDAAGNYIKFNPSALGNSTEADVYKADGTLLLKLPTPGDALGRPLSDGVNTWSLDLENNRISFNGATYVINGLNQQTKATDANGDTLIERTLRGSITKITPPGSMTPTVITRDGFPNENPVKIVDPNTGTTANIFDGDDNNTKTTPGNGNPTQRKFDANDRKYEVDNNDGSIKFAFDVAGSNVVGTNQAVSATSTVPNVISWNRTFDILGVSSETDIYSSAIKATTTYSHTNTGADGGIGYPSGTMAGYQRSNSILQAVNIQPAGTSSTTSIGTTVDPFGGPVRQENAGILANNFTIDTSYSTTNLTATLASGTQVQNLTITPGSDGITNVKDSVGSNSLAIGYKNGVLNSATGPNANFGADLDAVGNQTSQTGSNPLTFTITPGTSQINNIATGAPSTSAAVQAPATNERDSSSTTVVASSSHGNPPSASPPGSGSNSGTGSGLGSGSSTSSGNSYQMSGTSDASIMALEIGGVFGALAMTGLLMGGDDRKRRQAVALASVLAIAATSTLLDGCGGATGSGGGSPPPPTEPQTATPQISPSGGNFTVAQTVTITDSTSGAKIYYTTDGTTPTTNSSVYSTPLTVASTEQVQALATASGDTNSAVASATFTIAPAVVVTATPTISPNGGTFTAPQKVTIADTTPNATVYYTTDGTTPTTSSPVYSAPITVASTEQVQALATASGDTNSAIAAANFTIKQQNYSANVTYDGSGNVTGTPTPVTTVASTSTSTVGGGNQITGISGPGIQVAIMKNFYRVTPDNEQGTLVGVQDNGSNPRILTVTPDKRLVAEYTVSSTGAITSGTEYVSFPSDVPSARNRDAAIVTLTSATAASLGIPVANERGTTVGVFDSVTGTQTWSGVEDPQGSVTVGAATTMNNKAGQGRYTVNESGFQFDFGKNTFYMPGPAGGRYQQPLNDTFGPATQEITKSTQINPYIAANPFKNDSAIVAASTVASQFGSAVYAMTGTLDKPGSLWKVESNSLEIFEQMRETRNSLTGKASVPERSSYGNAPNGFYTVRLTPAQAAALEARDPN